jgi:hypothetical protein
MGRGGRRREEGRETHCWTWRNGSSSFVEDIMAARYGAPLIGSRYEAGAGI